MDNLFLDRRRWLHQAGMGLGMLGVGSLLEAEAASDQGRRRARVLRDISDHHTSFDVQIASLLVTEIIDSQGGTPDLAETNELIDNPADRIHRNSEAYAGVTSAAADDGRVDPDQLTARIEQWAA